MPFRTPGVTTAPSACSAALEAIRALQRAGFGPRRSIELIYFTSEEPTRFGIGLPWQPPAAGSLDPRGERLRDQEARTLDEVRAGGRLRRPVGGRALPPGHITPSSSCTSSRVRCSNAARIPLGVVTAIAAPASRVSRSKARAGMRAPC